VRLIRLPLIIDISGFKELKACLLHFDKTFEFYNFGFIKQEQQVGLYSWYGNAFVIYGTFKLLFPIRYLQGEYIALETLKLLMCEIKVDVVEQQLIHVIVLTKDEYSIL